jgi:methionine-rich copper-binding protein CopC
MRRLFTVMAVLLAASGALYAGTMSIAWDPVSDGDLAGYRVYYGTAPGNYPMSKDVGNTTSTTLTGLDPCTRYYVAVKAYDTGGLESASYSNEIAGLPRPVLNTVVPAAGDQGASLTLTLTGESYDAGATVEFSGTGITVLAVRRDSCSQLSVDIQIAANAPTGARDVTVMNADRSFGTKTGGFTVNTNAAPTVTSTNPAAGATNIAVTVKPTVTFSERMDPASITASTVRLLDSTGAAVAQAAGSPALSADGLTATITPAANLGYSKTYRTNAIGGASGVKDITGKTMASDYTQSPGFTTASAPDTTPPTVSGTNPADGATNVVITVKPQVVFSEAMDAATITSSTVQLLDSTGTPVAQAAGSPALSADGLTATITPAANLKERANYKVRVVGGSSGAKDRAGNALATTFTQATGFTTENLPPKAPTNNRRSDTR